MTAPLPTQQLPTQPMPTQQLLTEPLPTASLPTAVMPAVGTWAPPTPPAPQTAAEERTWSMLAHLSGLVGVVGALVVYLVKKDTSAAVAREAKESLNFQLSMGAYFLIALVVGTVLTFVIVGIFILMLAPLIPLMGTVFSIIGAVKANAGGSYRYPLTVRVIR